MCRAHLDSNSNSRKSSLQKFEYKLVIRWYEGTAVNFVRCANGTVITLKKFLIRQQYILKYLQV